MTQPTDPAARRWYRTGRSWGITIVEQTRPDADDPACQSRLVALALDHDTADRIVALLNADEAGTQPVARWAGPDADDAGARHA